MTVDEMLSVLQYFPKDMQVVVADEEDGIRTAAVVYRMGRIVQRDIAGYKDTLGSEVVVIE